MINELAAQQAFRHVTAGNSGVLMRPHSAYRWILLLCILAHCRCYWDTERNRAVIPVVTSTCPSRAVCCGFDTRRSVTTSAQQTTVQPRPPAQTPNCWMISTSRHLHWLPGDSRNLSRHTGFSVTQPVWLQCCSLGGNVQWTQQSCTKQIYKTQTKSLSAARRSMPALFCTASFHYSRKRSGVLASLPHLKNKSF